jgi:hypothetical protein
MSVDGMRERIADGVARVAPPLAVEIVGVPNGKGGEKDEGATVERRANEGALRERGGGESEGRGGRIDEI